MDSKAMLRAARSALCRLGHNNRTTTNATQPTTTKCLLDGIRHRRRPRITRRPARRHRRRAPITVGRRRTYRRRGPNC